MLTIHTSGISGARRGAGEHSGADELATVCGADAHKWYNPQAPNPIIWGHENSGEVAKLGASVKTDILGKTPRGGDRFSSTRRRAGAATTVSWDCAARTAPASGAIMHNLIEAIPEDAWTPIPYWMDGAADVAETTCTPFQAEADAAPVRLIVRRVKPTPGSQLALFAKYSYHGFITDRDGELLELEADHRRHAEIENAIRDLKYGVGLNHLPSGRFAANGVWLAVQTMAHNLARWTARIGLGERIATTKTLRRRFFSLAGRLTRSARRLTLHLPDRWPWAEKFSRALARLRAIPLPA